MICPKCKVDQFVVNDTRQLGVTLSDRTDDPLVVRRYRQCLACGHRLPTYEISADQYNLLLQIQRILTLKLVPHLARDAEEIAQGKVSENGD